MAIFHSHAGVITRSKGKSAIAASAYINGDKYYNGRQGLVHDYSKKERVLCKGVLVPEEGPEWAYDKEKLWNNVDKFEDNLALKRFAANYKDEEKNRKSLIGREEYLNSCQTAQTLECALPVELDLSTCKKIVEEYLSERFVSRGLVVDYAIHFEEGNPHFHALITRRSVDKNGFKPIKDQEILSKSSIKESRKLYADKVNKYLELAGIDIRIDHRSYKEQGIDLVASRHKGWQASDLERTGEYSRIAHENESIRQENIEILFNNPSQLIELVASKKSVFTSDDIAKEILKRVGGDDLLFSMLVDKLEQSNVLEEVQVSDRDYSVYEGFKGNIIGEMKEKVAEYSSRLVVESREVEYVGRSISDKLSYTSKEYSKLERGIFSELESINRIGGKGVDRTVIEEQIALKEESLSYKLGKSSKLSEEQKEAIIHLTGDSSLSLLEGRAGSGKTTILETVARSYEELGYRVVGTSFQGKVTEIMEDEIGIDAWTVDYLRVRWDKYRCLKSDIEQGKLSGRGLVHARSSIAKLEKHQLNKETVVLVDEANMIGINLWKHLSKEVSESGAKLIVVQDRSQLKSVHIGDVARGLVEKYKDNVYELRSVYRQQVAWQREASTLLNDHNIIDGLKPYIKHKAINWDSNQLDACRSLVRDYISDKQNSSEDRLLIMSFLNSKVNLLNRMVHDELKKSGYLIGEGINVGGKEYLVKERIVFTQNDNYGSYVANISNNKHKTRKQRVGVKNGSFGVIKEINSSRYKTEVIVELDDKRLVSFNPLKFNKFDYGYGITINKSEGITVDRSYVLLDNKMTANLTLIAMTRHREEVKCYVSEEEFTDNKELAEKLSKSDYKALVEDYSISNLSRPYYDMVKEYRKSNIEVGNIIQEIVEDLPADKEIYEHRDYKKFEKLKEKRDSLAKEIIRNWSECSKFTLQAGIKKNTVEYHAGLRQRELSDLEKKAALTTEIYLAAHEKASTLWQEIKSTHPGYLAKEHEKYGEYVELKRERDSIAYVIAEDKNLYRPFFRTGSKEKEVDSKLQKVRVNYFGDEIKSQPRLADVIKQADAHLVNETARSLYARLTNEEKKHYDLVKSYSEARNMVASYIGSLKEASVDLVNTDHNVIRFKSTDVYQGLKQARLERDKAALVIASDIDKYTPYFSLFKVKEEKLLEHASIEDRALDQYNNKDVIEIKERRYSRSYESYIENRYSNYNIFELKEAISTKLPELAVNLLGGCNNHLSTKEELRFGSKGSIAVSLSGSKQGMWYDFSEGRGGDIFSLVSREKGVNYKDALDYVASMVGINPENKLYDLSEYRKNVKQNVENSLLQERAKTPDKNNNISIDKLRRVNRLYESSIGVEGTLAERYLKEHRGIESDLREDVNIRYIEAAYEPINKEKLPAMLACMRDKEGNLRAAQVTYLDKSTGNKAAIGIKKRSYGSLKGSLVEISRSNAENNRYIVAEGVETALSIKEAGIDANIYASLGISNMSSIRDYLRDKEDTLSSKESLEIIIAADNDGKESKTLSTLEKVQTNLRAEGYQVKMVMPAREKTDFNDLLKAEGKESVKAVISEVLEKIEEKEIASDTKLLEGLEPAKSHDSVQPSDQEFKLMKDKYIAGIRLINRLEDKKESLGYLLTNIYGKERKEEARSELNTLVKEEGLENALSKIKDNSKLLGKLDGKRDWLLVEDERRRSAKEFSKTLYDRLRTHYNYLDERKEAQKETKEIYRKISYCNTAGKDYGGLVEEYKLVTTRLREVSRGLRIKEDYSKVREAAYVQVISENMARLTLLNRNINNKEPTQREIMDYREMASHRSPKSYVDPENLEDTLNRKIAHSREQWLKMRVALDHYHEHKEVNVLHANKYIKNQMAEEAKITASINDPSKLSEEKNKILYREMTGTLASKEVISIITEKQHELIKELLPRDASTIEKDYVEYRLAEGLIKRELLGENIKGDIAKIVALEIERDLKEIKKLREIEIAKEMQLQKERSMDRGIER